MFKLDVSVQNYDWGQLGATSTVADLARSGAGATVDDAKPYAELWMGVHPNGPSKLAESGEALADALKAHPDWLAGHENGTLQFLFKVLSVRKALSVQSHPTMDEARVLHARDPKNYPDDRHKPEMAIALTDFQLLCGFRVPEEIHANLAATPELNELLGGTSIDGLKSDDENTRRTTLKSVFTQIWSSPPEKISHAVAALISRLKAKENRSPVEQLQLRLDSEFPGGDVGVFAPLLLNYFSLKPGEATFLGPNQPHAYLLGDCVECMACSDNTIRAGLTPKFKDISTLCSNLLYTMSGPPIFPFQGLGDGVRRYAPPVAEFAVDEVKASAKSLPAVPSSSLLIVIHGAATLKSSTGVSLEISKGNVIFLTAGLGDVAVDGASSDFLSFRAFTPA